GGLVSKQAARRLVAGNGAANEIVRSRVADIGGQAGDKTCGIYECTRPLRNLDSLTECGRPKHRNGDYEQEVQHRLPTSRALGINEINSLHILKTQRNRILRGAAVKFISQISLPERLGLADFK